MLIIKYYTNVIENYQEINTITMFHLNSLNPRSFLKQARKPDRYSKLYLWYEKVIINLIDLKSQLRS
jgi:hypothetical protein